MADNFYIQDANTGDFIQVPADEVGSVKYPRVKLAHGVDGAASDASATEPLPVKLEPYASGGCSNHRTISAATTNGTNVKASAGKIYGIKVSNANAAARFLKLYDKATAPTVGTDTPIATYYLKAGELTIIEFPTGKVFSTGIGFGLTGAVGDADTTAVSANEHVVNIEYK